MLRRLIVPFLAIFILSLAYLTGAPTQSVSVAQSPDDFVADEVVVKFRPIAPRFLQGEIAEGVGADLRKSIEDELNRELDKIDFMVLKVPSGSVPRVVEILDRNPLVEYAGPNFFAQALGVTNDPSLPSQWGLFAIDAADNAGDGAWDRTQGSPSIKAAACDTGIQSDHPDLTGKVVAERDFTNSAGGTSDRVGHGTHVAGSIAALTNNGVGVAGAGYRTSLVNCKVLDDYARGTYAGIANGIIWAADQGVHVINLSLGGPYPHQALEDAVNYAWERGVVVIAASGNSGARGAMYPAGYPNVLAVGATDQNDRKTSWSNWGDAVDVGAPGQSIYSTTNGSSYTNKTGTSMSSSIVSGVAALVWGSGQCTTNSCVLDVLKNTADLTDGTQGYFRYGRINAHSAVMGASQQSPQPTNTPTPTPTPINTPTPTPTSIIPPTSTPTPTPTPTDSTSEEQILTVSSIEMWSQSRRQRSDVYIRVNVIDRGNSSPLAGASVSVELAVPSGQVYRGTTSTNLLGQATFVLRRTQETGVFTSRVTDISKDGYVYQPTVTEETLEVQ